MTVPPLRHFWLVLPLRLCVHKVVREGVGVRDAGMAAAGCPGVLTLEEQAKHGGSNLVVAG